MDAKTEEYYEGVVTYLKMDIEKLKKELENAKERNRKIISVLSLQNRKLARLEQERTILEHDRGHYSAINLT